ncbi:MAG: tryptophan-rich sensory protein [Candidatus Bathyarchaeia archaeon]
MSSKKTITLQAANILAFAITLAINGLTNTTLLGGKNTGQISDLYPTLITPAGYVFAIWGVIYTLLAVFVVYQALPGQRDKPFLREVSFLFVLSCVLNVLWLFLWQYEYIALSVVLMLALLATLVAIYLRLKIGKSDAALKEKACVHLPFSVYLGWITVAAAANVAAALSSLGWVKWNPADAAYALLAIVAVLVITLVVLAARRDVAYGLVIVWALVGIAVKQSAVQDVALAAEIGAVVVAIAVIASAVAFRFKKQKT